MAILSTAANASAHTVSKATTPDFMLLLYCCQEWVKRLDDAFCKVSERSSKEEMLSFLYLPVLVGNTSE